MQQALRLAALSFVVAATAFSAAPPPRPLGSAELQRLIEQLGDRDYRARDRAERRLFAEGVNALPLLRKALGHRDLEVRRRALRLVPGLEHAAIMAPKRITLNVTNQPLNVIMDEISKQSGYKIQYQTAQGAFMAGAGAPAGRRVVAGKGAAKNSEPLFSYTFVNEPFWSVIDRVCRDSTLYVQQGYGDDTVRLYRGDQGMTPYAGLDGAFRYVATNMHLSRSINLNTTGTPVRNESLTLNLSLNSEPRLPFLNAGQPRIEAAYDSEKNSMIPPTNNNRDEFGNVIMSQRYYGGGYKQGSIQVGLQLLRVSEKAGSIRLIRGVIPVTILVEQKPMVLCEDINKGKGHKATIEDLEFHVEDVTKQPNDQYSVKFTVTNKANANDYTWQNSLYNRLELVDDKGNKYQNWGSSWHSSGNNSVTLTLTFNGSNGNPKPGEAKRFIYQHWVSRQHDVQFELRDVPLP